MNSSTMSLKQHHEPTALDSERPATPMVMDHLSSEIEEGEIFNTPVAQPQSAGVGTHAAQPQSSRPFSPTPLNRKLVAPAYKHVTPGPSSEHVRSSRVRTFQSPTPASPVSTVIPPSTESEKTGRIPTSPRPFKPARYASPLAGVRVDAYPPAALPGGEYSRKRMEVDEDDHLREADHLQRRQARRDYTRYRHPQEFGLVRASVAVEASWREVEDARLEFNQRTLLLGDNWERLRGLATKLDRDLDNFNLERQAFKLEKEALEQERRAMALEKDGFAQERQAFELEKQALEHDRQAFEIQKVAFFLGRDEAKRQKGQQPPTK